MADPIVRDLLAAVEELERLPPEEPIRIIPLALREYDTDLIEHVLLGNPGAKPFVWSRFVAIGNLDALEHPVWAVYPSVKGAADWEELAAIKRLLLRQRVAMVQVEELVPLKASGVLTGAIALYGRDATDRPILIVGRHPDLNRAKAVCLLLAALLHAEEGFTAS